MKLLERIGDRRRPLGPDEFRSPYHGERMKFWRCSVHEGTTLSYAASPPSHCRGIWGHPEMLHDCEWVN